MADKKRVRFCDINPVTYAISVKKEIAKRHIENARSSERFATDEKINVFTGEEFGKEDNENSKFPTLYRGEFSTIVSNQMFVPSDS